MKKTYKPLVISESPLSVIFYVIISVFFTNGVIPDLFMEGGGEETHLSIYK